MFNKDFYPTPTEVIEKMLMGADLRNKIILEPSAGKGNIVDYLNNFGAKEVLVCEKENDLAKIVSQKARFLCSDFLSVRSTEISHIDMIVMNPPFSNEEKHILHAWEIAPGGCHIISLCNHSVIRNPHIRSREEIRDLIQKNGRSDNFGDCFSTAERGTGVEVGCIWLYKPKAGDDEFADYFELDDYEEQGQAGIVQYNYVRDIVGRYVQAVSMYDEVMAASNKINEKTKPIAQYGIKFGAYYNGSGNNYTTITRDVYKKELQKQCWQKVFADMNMQKYMTKGVRENINKFVETQIHIPFTIRNIYKMVELIVGTHANRMGNVLVEAFNLICSYAPENCTAKESWKTNSDYMVNKKFIVPYICEFDSRYPHDNVRLTYSRNREEIEDVVKALCVLSGTNFDTIPSIWQFVNNTTNLPERDRKGYAPMRWGTWYDWGFFRIRGYKKGTMHFEFLDDKLWERFNIEVSKVKGWRLPKQSTSTKKARKKGTGLEVI